MTYQFFAHSRQALHTLPPETKSSPCHKHDESDMPNNQPNHRRLLPNILRASEFQFYTHVESGIAIPSYVSWILYFVPSGVDREFSSHSATMLVVDAQTGVLKFQPFARHLVTLVPFSPLRPY
jgi:hypothetical protein